MILLAILLAQAAEPGGLRILDEGTLKGRVDTINCVGAGVACSVSGRKATFNIAGGGVGGGTPGGLLNDVQINDGAGGFAAYAGTSCAYAVKTLNSAGTATCTVAPTIPADLSAVSFWTRVPEASLSNETPLGSLATGILLNTTTTGVPTIYAGTSCAYAVKTLDASGASTCTAAPTIPTDISGAHYITTQAEANLSAEAVVPTCVGTDKLTFQAGALSCATDQTGAPGGGYTTIQDESGALAAESTLNFLGAGVTCVDNGVSLSTDCTIPGGSGYSTVADEGTGLTQRATVNFIGGGVTCVDNAGATRTDCTIPVNPTDLSAEPFITKTASANLSNEFALSGLATAILINTTTTGIPTAYAGATSCTNQFMTGLSSIGASTCTTDTLASAQHANQGTTTTVLHGNAAGNPSFSGIALADHVANLGTTTTVLHGNAAGQPTYGAVVLSTDVSGTLGAANGGTATTQGLGACVTLGTATGATTTVGPVTWTGTFNTINVNYEITGYNGGTPVGRVLVGAASISTTALTNGTSGYEGVAGTLTNSLSIPGAPLAVTLSSVGRRGTFHLFGRSGAIKRYWIEGMNENASVSVASTLYRAVGNFSDLGTNLPIQRAQLTVYDALNSTAASAQTFNTGTTITVIGCP